MKTKTILNYCFASVWLTNGLFCKVLNLTPRHQEIVQRILGDSNPRLITLLIGVSEVIMAIWILSKHSSRLNTYTQITFIASMNIIEFIYAKDLLLWGKYNSIFAFLFISLLYYYNYKPNYNYAILS